MKVVIIGFLAETARESILLSSGAATENQDGQIDALGLIMSVHREERIIAQHNEIPLEMGAWAARLRDSGVDVWALVMYYQQAGDFDVDVVGRDYDIPRAAVDAALAYSARHRAAIDARILLNTDVEAIQLLLEPDPDLSNRLFIWFKDRGWVVRIPSP